MNKLKKLITLVFCALVLTGCELKYEGNVEITEDGNITMSVIAAYDRELVSTLIYLEENNDLSANGGEDIPEASITDIREFLDKNKPEEQDGMEISRYEKNNYYGYRLSYQINNIDDVSSSDDTSYYLFDGFYTEEENNNSDKEMKLFKKDGDTYYANYKIGTSEDNSNTGNANLSMVNVSLKYSVTLPTKPIEHNADTVSEDGKTLTWNIDTSSEDRDELNYSFKLKEPKVVSTAVSKTNTEMIMLIIGIVVIVIVIVVVLVLFAKNNKKLDKSLEVLDQTIPSAAPKKDEKALSNNSVSSNVEQNKTITSEVTPKEPQVQTIETVVPPQETVTQNNSVVTSEQEVADTNIEKEPEVVPMSIESVNVVDNIPVVGNTTQEIKENVTPINKASNEVLVTQEEKTTPEMQTINNVTSNEVAPVVNETKQESITSNLDDMPIIMEPSVMSSASVQVAPIVNEIKKEEEEVKQNIQDNYQNTVINEKVTGSNEVVNEVKQKTDIENIQEGIKLENTITSIPPLTVQEISGSNLVEESTTPVTERSTNSVVSGNVVNTTVSNDTISSENISTPSHISETNIFDTPNIYDERKDINAGTIENTAVSRVLEDRGTVLTNESAPVETLNTVSERPNDIQIEPAVNQVNRVSEPVKEEVEVTPMSIPDVTNEPANPIEEAKAEKQELEVLENVDKTLSEPDIPLPPVEEVSPVVENTILEEAPTISEIAGNKFIQTDFIENRNEENKTE